MIEEDNLNISARTITLGECEIVIRNKKTGEIRHIEKIIVEAPNGNRDNARN